MNGFDQIKAFYSWVFNNPDKVRPTHISLYLFLWNQNNRSMWVEWFKCPYDLAMQGACIGNNKTYYNCLDQLQEWGLIEYKRGLNNYKAPMIKLIQLYDNAQLTEQVTVPLSAQVTAQVTAQLPAHINKLITDNKKLIIDNLEKWVESSLQNTNYNENDFFIMSNEKIKGNPTDYCLNNFRVYVESMIMNFGNGKVTIDRFENNFRLNYPNGSVFSDEKHLRNTIRSSIKVLSATPIEIHKQKYISHIPEEENKW